MSEIVISRDVLARNIQGHSFPESSRGLLVFWLSRWIFFGASFRGFWAVCLGKAGKKNPRKHPPENPRFSREVFDQNSGKSKWGSQMGA